SASKRRWDVFLHDRFPSQCGLILRALAAVLRTSERRSGGRRHARPRLGFIDTVAVGAVQLQRGGNQLWVCDDDVGLGGDLEGVTRAEAARMVAGCSQSGLRLSGGGK